MPEDVAALFEAIKHGGNKERLVESTLPPHP